MPDLRTALVLILLAIVGTLALLALIDQWRKL